MACSIDFDCGHEVLVMCNCLGSPKVCAISNQKNIIIIITIIEYCAPAIVHTHLHMLCCAVMATLFVAIVYSSIATGLLGALAMAMANGIYDCGNIRRQHLSPAALPIETEMRAQRSGNLITTSNLATSGQWRRAERVRHIYAAI